MKRLVWLVIASLSTGCINGVPLPPTPPSSLAVIPTANRDAQKAQYIELAQNYLRAQGKDPTQAKYEVHRGPSRDDDQPSDQPTTAAIVVVNFISAPPWQLAVKTNGDVEQLASP
jgi:hypothetical protein